MFFKVLEAETCDMCLEEGLALGELVLDVICMPPRREGLSMPVLLVAYGARGRACRAAWMF